MRYLLLLPASFFFFLRFFISLVDAGSVAYKEINESNVTITDHSYTQTSLSADDTAYDNVKRSRAVAHSQPKAYTYPPVKLLYPRVPAAKRVILPGLQGRKSALLGFLLLSAMYGFYFLHETDYSARASYYTRKILDASSDIEEKLDKALPFPTGIDTWLFTFALVLFASGLRTLVESSLHRRDVRRGIRTDVVPQLRGLLPLFMGLGALVSGVLMPDVDFLGNFGVGCFVAGVTLFTASLLRRQRYLQRNKKAEAARSSSM